MSFPEFKNIKIYQKTITSAGTAGASPGNELAFFLDKDSSSINSWRSIMADKLLKIKVENRLSSTNDCSSSSALVDSSTVKVKKENKVSGGGGGTCNPEPKSCSPIQKSQQPAGIRPKPQPVGIGAGPFGTATTWKWRPCSKCGTSSTTKWWCSVNGELVCNSCTVYKPPVTEKILPQRPQPLVNQEEDEQSDDSVIIIDDDEPSSPPPQRRRDTKNIKLEKAVSCTSDPTSCDTSMPKKPIELRAAGLQPVDTSVLVKEEDLGICYDPPIVEVESESELILENEDEFNETESGVRQIKAEKVLDSVADRIPSPESTSPSTSNAFFVFVDTNRIDYRRIQEEEVEECTQDNLAVSFEDEEDFDGNALGVSETNESIRGSFREHVLAHSQQGGRTPEALKKDLVKKLFFTCAHCPAMFQVQHELQQHSATVHKTERRFACSLCHLTYKANTSLRRHMKYNHTDARPFSCAICSASFKSKACLKGHSIIHSDDKPYTCAHCLRGFKTKSQLRSHINSHSTERPWKCPICPKRFAQKACRNMHMVTHSDARPFVCPHCNSAFKRKSLLLAHLETHLKKTETCPHCDFTCGTKRTLLKHAVIVHSEKPYACSNCPAAFERKADLNKHVLVHAVI